MIQFVVPIIILVLYLYTAFTFFSYTSLILNFVLLLGLYVLIARDLKDKEHHKYYVWSLLLTSIFFIFSYTNAVNSIIVLFEKMYVSLATLVVFGVFLFARALALAYEYYNHLKEKR